MTTVLITGANRGIGLELARAFSARGDSVFAACRNLNAAADLDALAASSGGRVAKLWIDVTNPLSIARARDELGDRPLDVLVNNAGIIGPERQSSTDTDFDGFLRTLDTNVLGPLRVAQAFLPNLRRAGSAKIVTVTSRMGSLAAGGGSDRVAYRTSKAAVNKAMQALAADLRPEGIAVLMVHPGWVATDMGGRGADLSPERSAADIVARVDALTLAGTGAFLDHAGGTVPW